MGTTTANRELDLDRGRLAEKPSDIPAKGWKDVLYRVKEQMKDDNVPLLSAGLAYYTFLALFPALIALISIYGLVASPADVAHNIHSITRAMPRDAASLLTTQMQKIAGSSDGGLAVGLIVSVLLALWSASAGMQALIKAVNVTYNERETRKPLKLRGLALLFTVVAVIVAVVALGVIAVVPPVLSKIGFGHAGKVLVQILIWPALALVIMTALAVVYRYAPNRDNAEWRWVSWGAVVATVLWILASVAFSVYANNFGKYNKTYGAFGAVIVLMVWLYLSAMAVLIGAEINAEMEKQTAYDTTEGRDEPMGQRDALAADTLGEPAPSRH